MKWRTDYHKNTKVIRVTLGQYGLLKQLAGKYNVSIAQALDLILRDKAEQEQIAVPASQIPMPVFQARAKPAVIASNGHPAPVILMARTKPAVVTNNGHAAPIITKVKEVRIDVRGT